MATGRVQVINEATENTIGQEWALCLQWCRYIYDNGEMERGYRFIYRRENGNIQAARGGARIPSLEIAERLIKKARTEGWGDYLGD